MSFLIWPTVLMPLLVGSLMCVALVFLAIVVRVWKRIFYRKRARSAPPVGTIWITHPLQFASLMCIAVMVYLLAFTLHLGELTNFYQIGHLHGWFVAQNIISAIALLAILIGVISGLAVLSRPLRWITKAKFVLVTLSCVYLGWFMIFFHFVGSTTRY